MSEAIRMTALRLFAKGMLHGLPVCVHREAEYTVSLLDGTRRPAPWTGGCARVRLRRLLTDVDDREGSLQEAHRVAVDAGADLGGRDQAEQRVLLELHPLTTPGTFRYVEGTAIGGPAAPEHRRPGDRLEIDLRPAAPTSENTL